MGEEREGESNHEPRAEPAKLEWLKSEKKAGIRWELGFLPHSPGWKMKWMSTEQKISHTEEAVC